MAASGWRMGWLATGNRLSHPKIPNYERGNFIAPTVISERLRGDWKINMALYADAAGKGAEGQAALDAFAEIDAPERILVVHEGPEHEVRRGRLAVEPGTHHVEGDVLLFLGGGGETLGVLPEVPEPERPEGRRLRGEGQLLPDCFADIDVRNRLGQRVHTRIVLQLGAG